MKRQSLLVVLALLTALVILAASQSQGTPPTFSQYWDCSLEPVSLPESGGQAILLLTFRFKPEYTGGDVIVEVETMGGLCYYGPTKWIVSLAKTGEFSTELVVDIPPKAESAIEVKLRCRHYYQTVFRYIYVRDGKLEVSDWLPRDELMDPDRQRLHAREIGPPYYRECEEVSITDTSFRGLLTTPLGTSAVTLLPEKPKCTLEARRFLPAGSVARASRIERGKYQWDALARDTFAVVWSQVPDAAAGQMQAQLDIYVFNDGNGIFMFQADMVWDNPNLRLDSAVSFPQSDSVSPLQSNMLDKDALGFLDNQQRLKLVGWFNGPAGLLPVAQRRLWVRYYFSALSWVVGDSVVADTSQFARITKCKLLSDDGHSYIPVWAGKAVAYDANTLKRHDSLSP